MFLLLCVQMLYHTHRFHSNKWTQQHNTSVVKLLYSSQFNIINCSCFELCCSSFLFFLVCITGHSTALNTVDPHSSQACDSLFPECREKFWTGKPVGLNRVYVYFINKSFSISLSNTSWKYSIGSFISSGSCRAPLNVMSGDFTFQAVLIPMWFSYLQLCLIDAWWEVRYLNHCLS